ncbi:MAG: SpoIIE family protein phosphatase [Acidobacteria bacterium]|nr:SpoIIE family protein phosphatase [Acidobacteriota bacterium]
MAVSENVLKLRVCRPNVAATDYALTDDVVTIGRAESCTIQIPDRYLSRQHAQLTRKGDAWFVSDKGSANGTYLNGHRVESLIPVTPRDRITIGENEIIMVDEGETAPPSRLTITPDLPSSTINLSLPAIDASTKKRSEDRQTERLNLLNRLAMELLEEKPMEELFDFIVDKVMELFTPTRVALGVLAPDRETFTDVRVRRSSDEEDADLRISRTLLNEVVEKRRAVSFADDSDFSDLAAAKSIAGQSIRAALCAPIIVRDEVTGILYIDYKLTQRLITEEDVALAAQVARIAARKLETTLLREEVEAKQRMEKELETAFLIQSRLLPSTTPEVEGFIFASYNQPCRTVGGDYYDFVVRPDGRIYVIIADVSGKGITAALVMAGVAASFYTMALYDHSPSRILTDLNRMLAAKTDPSMFVTAFCALVDPATGKVSYCNGGHNPPILIAADQVTQIETNPGVALGVLGSYVYTEGELEMPKGGTLFLYTDGITEAANAEYELFEVGRLIETLERRQSEDPREIALESVRAATEFAGGASQSDDIAIVCVQRTD